MAAAPPPWPHASAATTETQVCFRGKCVMHVHRKPSDDSCSVRLQGDLILSHGARRFGPNGWFVDVADRVVMKLDHRLKVYHPAAFQCLEVCSELIHNVLADAPATRECECDLAADNWVDPSLTPHDIAMDIVRVLGPEILETEDVPGYDVVIELPKLWVSMVYTDPKALLLACKETVAARVSARRRKPAGELCAICLFDFSLEAEEEEAARLPCSHRFHSGCIEPWFHRASTCPTCRRDVIQRFNFVR